MYEDAFLIPAQIWKGRSIEREARKKAEAVVAAASKPSPARVTTKERGMGLGLSLCQMIVDRHNGELSVSSDVGKGTRFEVTLPFEPDTLVAPAKPPSIQAGPVNVET